MTDRCEPRSSGLGRIYDLNVRAYVDNPDVEVVALVDPSEERRVQRQRDWPDARTFASAAELAASDLEVDAVEALLPIPLHVDGVIEMLGYGWHVNLQKPMCNNLDEARRMLDAARSNDRVLRVMENYVFYEPLVKLKDIVESGELGPVSGYHLKMVASGRGGWDVPASSYDVSVRTEPGAGEGSSCSTTAGTSSPPQSGSSGPSRRCGPGSVPPRSYRASRSTRRPPSSGSTTPVSEGCGTSPSPWTCTCVRTTTPTTSAGRSPDAGATPA